MAHQPNITQPTPQPIADYLASVTDEKRRTDAAIVIELMQQATQQPPVMWGTGIVGFGTRHYVYASGREGDTVVVGLSARKAALTLYGLFPGPDHPNVALAARLGAHTHGKGCLYIKDLDVIDRTVLAQMVTNAYNER